MQFLVDGAIAVPSGARLQQATTTTTMTHSAFSCFGEGAVASSINGSSGARNVLRSDQSLQPSSPSAFLAHGEMARGVLAFCPHPLRMQRVMGAVSPDWRMGLSNTPTASTGDRVLSCAELTTIAWWEWRLQGRRATLAVDVVASTPQSEDDDEGEGTGLFCSTTAEEEAQRTSTPSPRPHPSIVAIPWASCPLTALHVVLRSSSGGTTTWCANDGGRGGCFEWSGDLNHSSSFTATPRFGATPTAAQVALSSKSPLSPSMDVDVRHVLRHITRARLLETLVITASSVASVSTPGAATVPSLGTSWSSTYNNCLLPVRHHPMEPTAKGRMRLSVADIVVEVGSLQALSVRGAHILGGQGVPATAQSTATTTTLDGDNGAGSEAAASSVLCSLDRSPLLRYLRLIDCTLDDDLLVPTVQLPNLQTATVSACVLPRNGLRGLVEGWGPTTLTRLSVCNSNLHDVTPLRCLVHLTHLNLTGNANLEDVGPLAALGQLEALHLVDCAVRTVAPLAACASLRSLDASRNLLEQTAGGVGHLKRLQRLVLAGCGLSNVASLANLNQLRYLSLVRNKLEEGRLPRAFVALWFLEELDLSRTHLVSLRNFEGFRRLQKLTMAHNRLAHNAFSQHLGVLPLLRELHAEDCGLDDLRRLPVVCPELRVLHVPKNKQLTDDRMPWFAQVPLLESLNLSGCSLTGMACLKGCRGLRALDVSENTLSRGASELADVTTVEVLNLGNCGIRDTSFLTSLLHVRQVDLRGNVLNFGCFPTYMMHVESVRSGANVMSPGRNPHHPPAVAAASAVGDAIAEQHHLAFEDPLSWSD